MKRLVAPHAGAWIEIGDGRKVNNYITSPLTQGRGLKYSRRKQMDIMGVAPHAGAWIEICLCRCHLSFCWSPLTQGRGLKFITSKFAP